MSELHRLLEKLRHSPKHDAAMKELRELNTTTQNLVAAAQKEQASDQEWELVYDAVFSESISDRVRELIKIIGMRLDYYDPDSSYEEDVMEYASALNSFVSRLV